MSEVERNRLTALVARAADFYGPDNKNSAFNQLVAQLAKGQKPQTIGKLDKVHTYTYTPDAARATALLGNTADAYQQVWHLPTTSRELTNRQWIQLAAKELDVSAKIQQVPVWMIRMLGLFIPIMRELPEIMYQFDQDYRFDSRKFEQRFGWQATSPEEGIRRLLHNMGELRSD